MTISDFIVSVLASILAGVIVIAVAGLLSRRARWLLTGVIGRLLGVDIDYVYANSAQADSDMKQEIAKARDIAVFASRGSELQRGTFYPVFLQAADRTQRRVRILLPRTLVASGETDWIEQREQEVARFDPAFGGGLLHRQVEANVDFLRPHIAGGNVQLRLYNYPHLGRIVATERFLFFTPYESSAHGRDSRVYKIRCGDALYVNLMRLFEQLWNASSEPSQSKTKTQRDQGHSKATPSAENQTPSDTTREP